MTPTHARFSRLVRYSTIGAAMLTTLGGIALVASPNLRAVVWLVSHALHGRFDEWRFKPTTVWSSDDWKQPNLKYRYAVSDHVVRQIVVRGMSQRELELILGRADEVRSNGDWFYKAERPGFSLMQFSLAGLVVEFDQQQRVVRATKFLWLD